MGVTLFIGTRKGLFLASSDDRSIWQVEGPLFKGWEVTAGASLADGTYLAGTTSYVYGPAVHRSGNLREWAQFERGPEYAGDDGRQLKQIWLLRQVGERWYAGVAEAGLFVSSDEGASWSPVRGLNDHPTRPLWQPGAGGLCAHSLLVDPTNQDRMWCGISAVGVFRTLDGGSSWTLQNEGVRCVAPDKDHPEIGYCVHALAADPDNADLLYRQDHSGMYRSVNGADSWEQIENGLPSGFGFPLVVDRTSGAVYAFPLESDEYRMAPDGRARVYRTIDHGDSWQPMSKGLPDSNSYFTVLRRSMAIDSQPSCGVYFGTTTGQVFYSRDGGENWNRLPADFPRVLCLEVFEE